MHFGRVSELDALRGIAAFIVLLHHAFVMSGVVISPDVSLGNRIMHALLHFSPARALQNGRSPVLFFFVLSGFVLTAALMRRGSPGLLAFAVQRTIRLYLPVAAAVLFSFTAYKLVANDNSLRSWNAIVWRPAPGWNDVLREMALLRTERDDFAILDPVLWSLVHEWRLTVLMPLVLLFTGQPWLLVSAALVSMALGVLCGAGENVVHLGPWLHSSIAATAYFVPGIVSGAVLALFGPPPRLNRQQRLFAGTTVLALFGLGSDLATYAGSVLLIGLALQPGGLQKLLGCLPLVWLGQVSFSLYLVHVPVLMAAQSQFDGLVSGPVSLAIGVATALLAASLMHRWVERPSRELAKSAERRLGRSSPD